MAVVEISKIQVRRGQENQTGVPTLDGGEFAWASDTEKLYIGLRRIDGGSRDGNVRILTENDLRNFFSGNSGFSNLNTTTTYTFLNDQYVATSSTYNVVTIPADEITRTVQKKLDDFVSVKDFGALGDGINDDTSNIQAALANLYQTNAHTFGGRSTTATEKTLYFPAGNYKITRTLYMTRGTRILGEGMGNSLIQLYNTGSHFFKTVSSTSTGDTLLYEFETPMTSSSEAPNFISIEHIGLIHQDTTATSYPFISLDCSSNSVIRHVRFKGNYNLGITTINSYTGVAIRGYDAFSSNNVLIDHCSFEGLSRGITSGHDIKDIVISNNKFYDLNRGIEFGNPYFNLAQDGPRFINITNNSFENVAQEAIFVGTLTDLTTASNLIKSHIVSQNNRFIDVGNWLEGDLADVSTGTPVISYYTRDNISIGDYFARKYQQIENSIYTATTYNPLIKGKSLINDSGVVTIKIPISSTSTYLSLPILGTPQYGTVKYHFYNESPIDPADIIDRRGTIELYVGPGSGPNILFTDNYNFITNEGNIDWSYSVDVTKKFVKFDITNLDKSGYGATFDVTILPNPYTGSLSSGTYTNITLASSGQKYIIGDIVVIPGQLLTNGSVTSLSPDNDISITVTGINGSGGITTYTVGTSTATNLINTATFTAVTTNVTRSGGTGGILYLDYQLNLMTT